GYTEQDIREAARAFTGWQADEDRFEFVKGLHDDGPKTVFGKKGNWNGNDIVKMLVEKPECARFIVRKVYREFVSETPPPERLLEPLAESFQKSDHDIPRLMETVLSSRLFFSEHAFRQRLKSPVEFILCTVRSIHDPDKGLITPLSLVGRLDAMGQQLFAP